MSKALSVCKGKPERLVQVETSKTGQNRKAETSPSTAKHNSSSAARVAWVRRAKENRGKRTSAIKTAPSLNWEQEQGLVLMAVLWTALIWKCWSIVTSQETGSFLLVLIVEDDVKSFSLLLSPQILHLHPGWNPDVPWFYLFMINKAGILLLVQGRS